MSTLSTKWPVLRKYDESHSARIAMPIGGIGTGTISLGGRGNLRDFEIMNRPAKGFNPVGEEAGPAFFAIRTVSVGRAPVARLLEGPIPIEIYEGGFGTPCPWHGLPRFRHSRFLAAYPFGQVELSDSEVPLSVRLEAFNPLVPPDTEKSGLPAIWIRFRIRNSLDTPVSLSLCASLPNFIGSDGSRKAPAWNGELKPVESVGNRNAYRESGSLRGIALESTTSDCSACAWGSMALTTLEPGPLTYRTGWGNNGRWGGCRVDFWDDFLEDGRLDDRGGNASQPMASLCLERTLAGGAETTLTFLLTWRFPNRRTWTPGAGAPAPDGCGCAPGIVGNWYSTRWPDAWTAAEAIAPRQDALERETLDFVNALLSADLPSEIKEAALFNLSTLRSQTCFRTEDGHFFGYEGCCDDGGCCHGSCTHVWNYELAVPFLFGGLARDMREIEFAHATRDDGLMCFRIGLPLAERAQQFALAAADGQMGCLIKLYREWRLCGDDAFLIRLWPKARKALEFCWIPGGWDADQDGVMEGCQHNTMDVEYFGPNPQMGFWYLGALRAAENMARHLGETDFAQRCRALFDRGSAWMDGKLFNGEYYEHEIRPMDSDADVAPGLRIGMGAASVTEPTLQLGAGCLIDQLVGQYLAHSADLGHLGKPSKIRKALRSVLKYNGKRHFHDHFNSFRGFALGDERALLMASYPRGRRPKSPFPYYGEVMTGFEYCVAAHLIFEGLEKQGLAVVRHIRDRYDGRKRNPFDEAECGHHYARAMAAWGLIQAWSGFDYEARTGAVTFAPRAGTHFWANGDAWGLCRIDRTNNACLVSIEVMAGHPALKAVALRGVGRSELHRSAAGDRFEALVPDKQTRTMSC